MRQTLPRKIILQEIKNLTSHPTADEIYAMVRKRVPRVSLGTIYRNLEILCQEGLIQKLDVGGTQRRFDGRTENHYHFRCLWCGRIFDLTKEPWKEIESRLASLTPHEVQCHHLELIGRCTSCKVKADLPAKTPSEIHQMDYEGLSR
jgi:Fur family transcriptional regulator, ferric uptake regulator